ncbi:hypothetical protein B0A55_06428 [Friedmanniomyces simplex]|uniref:FAD-binding domain-containing protein n=1 Tax=Friedmanniomyces simplex TaxID=329884 RepID=A0A4U0X7L9_9PEZI|nr:hypothetical protein B0A55_06428 [Friedmanniomyces simplex]
MNSPQPIHVAIIGGGLCGLALAVALKQRDISFKVYEARSSFTELGAGINIGPNTLEAFRLIDASLGNAYLATAARNPSGKEHVWFDVRLGAAIDGHKDGETITSLMAPPTGSMCIGRDALLQLLAQKAGLLDGPGRVSAAFDKKLTHLEQSASGVTMHFEDGTSEQASAVVACDGIHSAAPAVPQYSEAGVYRAMLPVQELEKVLGHDMARTSQVFPGPKGYLILYPVSDTMMNTGFWVWRRGTWPHREWVLPGRKNKMDDDLRDWGDTVRGIMNLAPNPPFMATHYHAVQPESHWRNRVCLIGDAAHAMPPHAGAGSGQAMEDAYVMAEVFRLVNKIDHTQAEVNAAFSAYEAVRRPRYQSIVETSVESMHTWSDLYDTSITQERLADWTKLAHTRFESIWNHDIGADARNAQAMMREKLKRQTAI